MGNPAFDKLVAQYGGANAIEGVGDAAAAGAAGPKPALGTTKLMPIDFYDDWHRKPTGPVEIGFRFVSEGVAGSAQMAGSRVAWISHGNPGEDQDREDMRGSFIVSNILARACVMPHDRSALFFGTAPEDEIRMALTTDVGANGTCGLKKLWEAYEVFVRTESDEGREADDDDVDELAMLLTPERVNALPSGKERRLRRLIPLLLDELR